MSDNNITPAPPVPPSSVAIPPRPDTLPGDHSTDLVNHVVEPTDPGAPPANKPGGWRRLTAGTHGFLALLLIIVAAALAGFAVSGYGFTMATLRLAGIFLLVFLIVNYTAGLLKWIIARGRSHRARLVVRPIHLLVLVLVVVFTQLIGATPVLVFGLLLAVDRPEGDHPTNARRDARLGGVAVLVGVAWTLLLGAAAAVAHAYVAAHPFADLVRWSEIDATRAQELATAIDLATIIGLELSMVLVITTIGSLPLLLLPMWTFEGRLLWEWNRVVWVVTYFVALLAAGMLVAPSISAGSWWLWAAPFIAYAVIAVVLFFVFRGRGQPQPEPAPEPQPGPEPQPEQAVPGSTT